MKKNIILVLLIFTALIGCKKDQVKVIPKHESFAFDKPKPVVIFSKTVTQSNILTYKYGTKTLPLLFNRTIAGNVSNCALADTAGNTIYLTFTINDVTGVISNISNPNYIPFDKILPVGTDASWKSCMGSAIKGCAANPLCSSNCRNEALIGCLLGWAGRCIFGLLTPTVTPIKPHIINNLPPIVYV